MKRLTANLIFYPTLLWNLLLGRVLGVRHWWDEVDDDVVIGALPFPGDVPKLSELGIGAVVNTCYEYEGPRSAYQRYGIEQLYVPTVDFSHPTLESLETAVRFMENEVKQGKRVYVHCKAGRARSATVVICWLIKHDQITAREAQERLLRVRPHVNPRVWQRPVVQEFEARYLKSRNASS
jgi:atypical dual specificity phosphatase